MTANEALGMTWWNGMTRFERSLVSRQAEQILGRHVSAADCWDLWRAGRVSMEGGAS